MRVAYQQLCSTTLRHHLSPQKFVWSRSRGRKAATFGPARSRISLLFLRHRASPNNIVRCSLSEPDAASSTEIVPLCINHDAFGPTEEHEWSSNGNSDTGVSSSISNLNASDFPVSLEHDDADGYNGASECSISSNLPETGKNVEKGKIRRFPLTDPGLLKTIQEAKLTPLEKANFEKVMKFKLTNKNLRGELVVQAVRTEHTKDLENLLTDSFSELMWGPLTYRPALAWIISTHLRERQACIPNAVILVGLYNPVEETRADENSCAKWLLAGAVEVSFNACGKPMDIPTPLPPDDSPFLSNMAVLRKFRRRGIGRELLKGAEQLVRAMGGEEMYLHCRMIDEAPLNMYKSSGYSVVETNSMLSLLLFQRRRHLMCKRLGDV